MGAKMRAWPQARLRRAYRAAAAIICAAFHFPPAMTPEALQLLVSREMPYGKYKGRLLADLPGHYLGWFAREGFPKGELGSLLALMYELDHNALRDLLAPLRAHRSPSAVKP